MTHLHTASGKEQHLYIAACGNTSTASVRDGTLPIQRCRRHLRDYSALPSCGPSNESSMNAGLVFFLWFSRVCMYARMHVRHTCMHADVHTFTSTHARIHKHTHTHARARAHTHTHKHARTHILSLSLSLSLSSPPPLSLSLSLSLSHTHAHSLTHASAHARTPVLLKAERMDVQERMA